MGCGGSKKASDVTEAKAEAGEKPMTLKAPFVGTGDVQAQMVGFAAAVKAEVGADAIEKMETSEDGKTLTAKCTMKSGEHAGFTLVYTTAAAAAAVAAPVSRWTPGSPNPKAVFETTLGTITCEIFLDQMEYTASNFIDLVQKGFYDGLHFHRVIPEFMDQFGCPHSKNPKASRAGTGGPDGNTSFINLKTGTEQMRDGGGKIKDEHTAKISNEPGTLSMANAGPNSGGSQFFMNVVHNDFLDWFSEGESQHPVFGKAADKASLDVMVKISEVATTDDNPNEPVLMKSVTITGL